VSILALLGAAAWRFTPLAKRAPWISDVQRVESHATRIQRAASEARVDPYLMAAIMLAESSGLPGAVSPVGALGLFQLMLPTARERARLLRLPEPSREDLLRDPDLNARLAAHYLAWLARRYGGRLEPMLVAYNAGPGRLDGWIKQRGSFEAWREVRRREGRSQVLAYVDKVLRYRTTFAERGRIAPAFDQPGRPAEAEGGAPRETFQRANLFGPPTPDARDR
jgi:soluble lytic murein transglycosylase